MASLKVWFITGTSTGFGRRLVTLILARGDRVIATARSIASIAHFREDPAHRSNIHCAELDIAIGTEQVKSRIDTIIAESGWGTVDVLVNNAGVGIPSFIEEGGTALLKEQFQANVFGTLDVTTAVLPYMHKKKSGTVVIVASRSVWKPEIKGIGLYASSKAAIHALAEGLAVELEHMGIRMLIVGPGSFRTEGIFRYEFDASNRLEAYEEVREQAVTAFKSPEGKQPGDPLKAMEALVEVVYGEGRAKGREWPLYLVLGKDADRDVRKKCARLVKHLDEWSDVVGGVDLDDL